MYNNNDKKYINGRIPPRPRLSKKSKTNEPYNPDTIAYRKKRRKSKGHKAKNGASLHIKR